MRIGILAALLVLGQLGCGDVRGRPGSPTEPDTSSNNNGGHATLEITLADTLMARATLETNGVRAHVVGHNLPNPSLLRILAQPDSSAILLYADQYPISGPDFDGEFQVRVSVNSLRDVQRLRVWLTLSFGPLVYQVSDTATVRLH